MLKKKLIMKPNFAKRKRTKGPENAPAPPAGAGPVLVTEGKKTPKPTELVKTPSFIIVNPPTDFKKLFPFILILILTCLIILASILILRNEINLARESYGIKEVPTEFSQGGVKYYYTRYMVRDNLLNIVLDSTKIEDTAIFNRPVAWKRGAGRLFGELKIGPNNVRILDSIR